MTIALRPARPADIPAIVDLEKRASSGWNKGQIAAELAHADAIVLVVADQRRTIIGWSCLRIVGVEAELLKIAVHKNNQRCGHGTLLVERLVQEALFLGCKAIFLEVRAANLSARKLYRKSSFAEQGLRKNYYQNPKDDAVVCVRKLSP